MSKARRMALMAQENRDYLCFTAEAAGSTISMSVVGSPTKTISLETSTDKVNWTPFVIGTTTITLAGVGDKVYFRGDNETLGEGISKYRYFVMSGKIGASGNVQSLLDKTCESLSTLNSYCYANLFGGCTSLTTAPKLPATTLTDYCYYYMFGGCTSLTTAPELPATTLAGFCYYYMFGGCTSLTTAPGLPATTLPQRCYANMFQGCTSLTTAPKLPATTLATCCYQYMFKGCTSLTTAPKLPATTLAGFCYQYMFKGCTSLKVSSTQTGEYQYTWRIPTEGTVTAASTTWTTAMLDGTGGTFTSDPSINTTYYTTNKPI